METKARLVVMSHLSDIQEMIQINGSKPDMNNRLNFAKFIIMKLGGNLDQDIDPDAMYNEYCNR